MTKETRTPENLAFHVIQSLTSEEGKSTLPHAQALEVDPANCADFAQSAVAELQRAFRLSSPNGGDHGAALKCWQAYAPPLSALGEWYAGYTEGPDPELEPEPCPPLPESAYLDPALGIGAGAWIDQYIDYARQVSPMTPTLFHESAGLWLAAVAIARRLKINVGYGDVYPNLYILWLAPTTLWRKTTALEVARALARDTYPFLLSPQDTTPEGFLSDLAGREPTNFASLSERDRELWKQERNYSAQRGRVIDEISGMLASAGRDYNAGLLEAIMMFYDCTPRYTRSTRGQGRIVVRNVYLNILGASTPRAMTRHLISDRLWGMGWWPRFAVLTPDERRPTWGIAHEPKQPAGLKGGLDRLFNALPSTEWPEPPTARDVILAPGVHERWSAYNKAMGYDLLNPDRLDPNLWGSYGRLPTHALKVAMILAALDGEQMPPTIEIAHLARAQDIVERWRVSLHRVEAIAIENEYNRTAERIIYQIGRRKGRGATLRDLSKSIRDKSPAEIEEVLAQMIKTGEVKKFHKQPGPKGGRPTDKYVLAKRT